MADPLEVPSTSYSSTLDISLDQVPDIEDRILYEALLDIHNAIESLNIGKRGRQKETLPITDDYIIQVTDDIIILDGSIKTLTAFLPSAVIFPGYGYTIKCIDDTFPVFADTAITTETLEEDLLSFELFKGEYIDVTSDGTNWIVAG